MASIRSALGALILATTSATASATLVDLDFSITDTTRNIRGNGTSTLDPSFQPVSFHVTVRIDVSKPVHPDEESLRGPRYEEGAWRTFDPTVTSFTSTPFTDELLPAAAVGAETLRGSFYQAQLGVYEDADQPMPVHTQSWFRGTWASGIYGSSTRRDHSVQVALRLTAEPLSWNQFHKLTPEDLIAFFQSQIGVVYVGGFTESGQSLALIDGASVYQNIEYIGDMSIHAVTVVPEPSTLLLGLLGGALVSVQIGRLRRQT